MELDGKIRGGCAIGRESQRKGLEIGHGMYGRVGTETLARGREVRRKGGTNA